MAELYCSVPYRQGKTKVEERGGREIVKPKCKPFTQQYVKKSWQKPHLFQLAAYQNVFKTNRRSANHKGDPAACKLESGSYFSGCDWFQPSCMWAHFSWAQDRNLCQLIQPGPAPTTAWLQIQCELSTTWCLVAFLLVSDEVIFRRCTFQAISGDLSTPHISGRGGAPHGHTTGWCGPAAGPGHQCTPFQLYGSVGFFYGFFLFFLKVAPSRSM